MTDETKQALTDLHNRMIGLGSHARDRIEHCARSQAWAMCLSYQGRAEAYEDAAGIIEQAIATGTTEVHNG